MKTTHAYKWKGPLSAIVLAVLVLVITTAVAANRQMARYEQDVLIAIYNIPGSWNDAVFAVTQMGSLGALLVIALVALILRRRELAVLLLANTLVAYVITAVLKELVARPRPSILMPEITVRVEQAMGFGFPSSHTAIATVMALTLLPYTQKKYHWLLWLWIAAVAFSRMYLGVHAPLDIVAGLCVGVIVAESSRLMVATFKTSK